MGGGGKGGGGSHSHDYYGSIAGETNCERLDFIWGILRDDKIVWPNSMPWTAKTWPGGSIVVYNGRLYETLFNTSAIPPAAPWVLFKRDRVATSNPFKITIPDLCEAFLYWGTPTQTLDAVDEHFLSARGHPPYRWRTVLALKKCLFGMETQTAPNLAVLGGRAPQQALITGAAAQLDADWQTNPWCVVAELLTHPVIGLGCPLSMFHQASWQAEADWCYARSALTYISPFYDGQTKVRAIVPQILSYVDGFVFWNSEGQLQAGHWPHGEAPPAFTPANTLDMHDLTDEVSWDSESFGATSNATVVNFQDIAAAFNTRPAQASNLLNRVLTRRVNSRTVDRPFVVRAAQAAALAAEDAKLNGDPFFGGTLSVRAEKASEISPGKLFQLTDDLLQLTRISRCTSKTINTPPAGTVKLGFQSERGIGEQPYQATPSNPDASAALAPARVTNFQFVQVPDALAADQSFRLVCLAARNNAITSSLAVWWKQAEAAESFEQLATLTSFAVTGTVNSTINAADVTNEVITATSTAGGDYPLANPDLWNLTLESRPTAGDPWTARTEGTDYVVDYTSGIVTILDGGIVNGSSVRVSYSVYIRVSLAAGTPPGDFESISSPLTADEVNNNTLLLFVFKAGSEHQFEIVSVKSIEADGGGVYRVRIRRNSYATKSGGNGSHVWTSTDRAFFAFRVDLFPIAHESFEPLAISGVSATFRLVPTTTWIGAEADDVYDVSANPDGLTTEADYEFTDPFAPTVTWKVLLKNNTDIADFSPTFLTTDEFKFTFEMNDANADLSEATLVARLGNVEQTLWSQSLPASAVQIRTTSFKLSTEGDWRIFCVVRDLSGRVKEYELTPVSGGSAVTLKIRTVGSTTVATPVATPFGGGYPLFPKNVSLSCSTAGATIIYQLVTLYAAPGATWNTYTGPISVAKNKSLYAKATKSGLTDSATVRHDYWYERYSNL